MRTIMSRHQSTIMTEKRKELVSEIQVREHRISLFVSGIIMDRRTGLKGRKGSERRMNSPVQSKEESRSKGD
jgi:hypothetical protein